MLSPHRASHCSDAPRARRTSSWGTRTRTEQRVLVHRLAAQRPQCSRHHPGRQHGHRHGDSVPGAQGVQAGGQPHRAHPVPDGLRGLLPGRGRHLEPQRGEERRRRDRGERRPRRLLHLHRRLPHGLLLRLHQAQAVPRGNHDELRGHHHVDLGGRHGPALLERLHEGAALHHQRARALRGPGRRLPVCHRGRRLPHRHRAVLHPLRQRRRLGRQPASPHLVTVLVSF